MTPAGAEDHFAGGAAARLFDDRGDAGPAEKRFEHRIGIGRHLTLDDHLAQTPRAFDADDLWETAFRVQGEHDARGASIRAHHLLHADGEGHLHVGEAVARAVNDGAVVE